jgi:hypothetical protein
MTSRCQDFSFTDNLYPSKTNLVDHLSHLDHPIVFQTPIIDWPIINLSNENRLYLPF